MTSLVLMYVFFDVNGDIKAISPSLDPSLSNEFSSSTFPLSDVELFLTGKRNPNEYVIKATKKQGGMSYSIGRKFTDIIYTRTLDNYLTKISDNKGLDTAINIVNNLQEKVITLSIDANFRETIERGINMQASDEDIELSTAFLSHSSSFIYITEKNNPYILRHTISFLPRELFDRVKLHYEYSTDLDDSSTYTKKIVSKYSYKER